MAETTEPDDEESDMPRKELTADQIEKHIAKYAKDQECSENEAKKRLLAMGVARHNALTNYADKGGAPKKAKTAKAKAAKPAAKAASKTAAKKAPKAAAKKGSTNKLLQAEGE